MKQLRTSSLYASLLAAGIGLALGSAGNAQDSPGRLEAESERPQQTFGSEQSASRGSLDQLAQEHRNLSTFVRALEVTGLADSLTSGTQYTAFAPTDEAFDDIGRSVDQLLAPDNRQQLIAMLRAHIVADDVDPQMARQLNEALTLNGGTIPLDEKDGKLMVGDASVVDADVQHGNLRIYAIDQVLDRGEVQIASPDPSRPRG